MIAIKLHRTFCPRSLSDSRLYHFDGALAISDHAARFLSAVPLGDTLLISDYGKGVCTSGMLPTVGDRARAASVPILVDPAMGRRWTDYGQVTLIKANWTEATEAGGNHDIYPLALARRLADEHGCQITITLGRHGMVCAERNGSTWYLPAKATDVRDVCGAGDTVLAAIGGGMLDGSCLRAACRLAAKASELQVGEIGIVAVS